MTKTEFLEGLQEGLNGEVAPQVIRESVDYYNRYITDSIAEGKTEAQVLEELGPVRLIVKSIIDANAAAGRREETRFRQEQKETGKEEPSGFHAGVNDKGEFDVKYGKFSFNSWYGKLLLILLAVLIVVVVVALIVGVFVVAWYLLPLIAVVALIIILVKVFFGRRTC
ncbi:MAG: hypothetical protein K2N24_01015, partial [Lachnospiraceae bacterium]|nr:hypothetical protein [Lachnospiraceae bacterium]